MSTATVTAPPTWMRFPRRRLSLDKRSLLRRFISAVVSIWGVMSIVFVAILLTGNPARALVSEGATKEQLDAVTHLYGFDRPIWEQYFRFLGNTLTGHFPESLRLGGSPLEPILEAMPYTLALATAAGLLGTITGLLVGYAAAFAKRRLVREVPLHLLEVCQATPVFVSGLLLLLLFSITLKILPTGGARGPLSLILPAVTLSLTLAPRVAVTFRASLLSLSTADHVRAARTKDISMREVRTRHIALNAMIPVASVIGLQVGSMLGGSVLTESIFLWPGLGSLIVTAIEGKDFPTVIAAVMMIALLFIAVNTVVDILVTRLDPRAESSL
ncbi:MAG: ABC transporter permease [Propionibacteriaceae bacterium]|jgi:peptide/nickel transport system permease protein|nr:ABC transporter permease [Propionibacteriaceae bacterium]